MLWLIGVCDHHSLTVDAQRPCQQFSIQTNVKYSDILPSVAEVHRDKTWSENVVISTFYPTECCRNES